MQAQTHTRTKPARLPRWWRGEIPQILLMLLLLAAARDSFANHYYVPSGSMEHTLEIGDRVAVDMRAYGVRLPFTDVRLLEKQGGKSGHWTAD